MLKHQPAATTTSRALVLLGVLSAVMLVVRLYAATRVGFGDSEALYASWAIHPQPAYLDHPGLVGLFARVLGDGGVPSPARAHAVTAVLATLVPWFVLATARVLGAASRPAAIAAIMVALVPEFAVGLFAMTPDLLLAPLWLGALALASIGLEGQARDRQLIPARAAFALLGAGLLAGMATSAKVSGGLLMLALAASYIDVARMGSGRPLVRSVWPWAGLVAGAIVLAPVLLFEARFGWPMLRHRFVDTQAGAGLSLRNLGSLLGGQLVYLSPVVALVAVLVARDLVLHRHDDTASRVLFWSFALPMALLTPLCLWSSVAEPHWLAPPLLALPLHAARRAGVASAFARRKLLVAAAAVASAMTACVYAWVLIPQAMRLMPVNVDPKANIASELFGWPKAIAAVSEHMHAVASPLDPEGNELVVVGPHWTVCAQLQAALPSVRVGCATPINDDFDGWLPRDTWKRADYVLFVTDNRFPGDGAKELPALVRVSASRVRVLRGGRVLRTFELYLYARREQASLSTP